MIRGGVRPEFPEGGLRVLTRYWSNGHGAGRVTASARGVRRTVPINHATSGGMSGDGSHLAAVHAVLRALHLPTDTATELRDSHGTRRVYVITAATTTEES